MYVDASLFQLITSEAAVVPPPVSLQLNTIPKQKQRKLQHSCGCLDPADVVQSLFFSQVRSKNLNPIRVFRSRCLATPLWIDCMNWTAMVCPTWRPGRSGARFAREAARRWRGCNARSLRWIQIADRSCWILSKTIKTHQNRSHKKAKTEGE